MSDSVREIAVERVRAGQRHPARDEAAAEEPLEIRLHGRPFAVIMRTPGADRELAAGFLFAERVVRTSDELGAIAHCADRDAEHPENVVNVTLAGEAAGRLEAVLASRRQVATTSACGLCGRQTIDSLRVDAASVDASWTVSHDVLLGLTVRLRAAQAGFDRSGGLHAAGLFAPDGALDFMAEDVGRHNAVDKIVGRALMREALPLGERLLFVSGRTSFEIVQKAFLAGVPIVASVSAPSTLAVELADSAGMTLLGFVRDGSFNIYTHAERIVEAQAGPVTLA